jgi:hypothetical protein
VGDSRRAEFEAAQAVQLSPDDQDTLWMTAAAYEALGKRQSTITLLGGSPPAMLPSLLPLVARHPDMADLSHDPRFIQLMASNHVK